MAQPDESDVSSIGDRSGRRAGSGPSSRFALFRRPRESVASHAHERDSSGLTIVDEELEFVHVRAAGTG